jgi:6-phosphogluconolactonase
LHLLRHSFDGRVRQTYLTHLAPVSDGVPPYRAVPILSIIYRERVMAITRNIFVATLLAAAVSTPAPATNGDLRTGAVFVMTNQTDNEVIAYDRNTDGSLVEVGRFSTGGRGNPVPQGSDPATDPLASQGSLIVSDDGRFVLAANAKSNNISSMRITKTGLTLVAKNLSGGTRPVSIANFSSLIYVLNEGDENDLTNINGWVLGPFGVLRHLPESERRISNDPTSDAGQVALSRDGRLLTVTDKLLNRITTFRVNDMGRADTDTRVVTPSSGTTPFGVASDGQGHLIVAESQAGAELAGSLSSYGVATDGALTSISSSVANSQTAPCRVVVTDDAKFVYTTNTGSGQVSSYSLGTDGTLTLLESTASNTAAGSAPTDMALSRDGQFLYVIAAGRQSIFIFSVQSDGTLARVPSVTGLPSGVQGIAAN